MTAVASSFISQSTPCIWALATPCLKTCSFLQDTGSENNSSLDQPNFVEEKTIGLLALMTLVRMRQMGSQHRSLGRGFVIGFTRSEAH